MRKTLTLLIVFPLIFLFVQPVKAAPDIVSIGWNFVKAVTKKDAEQARAYLAPNVNIPEIREDTPIKRITGLPSPKENVSVAITYFDDGEKMGDRIAFIWELTFKKDKITDIRVVYDGSNPFMNETKIKKEYESKNKTKILTIYEFPFEITHVGGNLKDNELVLYYGNAKLRTKLQMKVKQNKTDLEKFKGENDSFHILKNGSRALYLSNSQLIFQYGDLLYTISIDGAKKQNNTLEDLLKVANSMKLMA